MKPSPTSSPQILPKKRNRRGTFTKSFSKVLDLFERSANSLIDRNSESAFSNQLVFKVVDFTAETFEFAKILELFNENQFVLIANENEVFSPDIRMTVWRMDKSRKIIFESLARKMKEVNEQPKRLQFLTFDRTKTLPIECESFVRHIITNAEEVFSPEGDALFDEDGFIREMSVDKFFGQLFDPYAPTDYIRIISFTANILTSSDIIVSAFIKAHSNYYEQKECNDYPTTYLENSRERIEQVVEIFLKYQKEMLSDEQKIEIKNVFSSPLYSVPFNVNLNELLSTNEGTHIKSPIPSKPLFIRIEKSERRKQKAMSITPTGGAEVETSHSRPKLVRTKSGDPLNIFESETAKVISISTETLINVNFKVFAEQLIVYDSEKIKTIPLGDLLDCEKSDAFQQYIKVLNKLEDLFVHLIVTTNAFKYFIKVAQFCIDLNDLNIAHLIFSVIVKQSMSCKEQFEALKKEKKLAYTKIYDLFSIHKNLCSYRSALKKIPFGNPRIPVISVFLKDMISFKEMDTFLNGKINYLKFRALTETIESIVMAQQIPYIIPPLTEVQKYLNSEMV